MTGPAASGRVTTRQRVREVLTQSGFRRLVATRFASQLGDGIFQLSAAKLLLFDHPGANPALTLTGLVAVTLIPFSVIVPFVGVFIDRWDRRKILTYTPAVRAGLAALLPLTIVDGRSNPAFFVVALLVLSANRLFLATTSAVLPPLVPQEDLLVANSVASTGGSIATVTGLGLGAAFAAVLGGSRSAVVAAVAFGGAGLLARRIPVHHHDRRERAPLVDALGVVSRELGDGLRHLASARRVRYALAAVAVGQLLIGLMTGASAVAFISRLHLGVGAVSTLLGAIGLGLGFGVALVPLVARRVREDFIVPIAFALGAAGAIVAGTLSRASMTASGVIVGLSYAFAKIPVDTIVQAEMPDEYRGRAFAVYDMIFNLSRVGGTAVAAAAVQAGVRPERIVSAGAVCYVFASAGLFVWARRIVGMRRTRRDPTARGSVEPPGRRHDLQIPAGEMVTVRAYAGFRADEEPRAVVVGGRELPVEAIEWRAVQERDGERRRVFVVRLEGARVRLAYVESSSLWEIERVLEAGGRVRGGGDES